MKKLHILLLSFIIGYTTVPSNASAKLTNNMNCTFKCSGKQCQNEMHTLMGCLVACNPTHYEKCWIAGEQKFADREDGDDQDDKYFREFNKLGKETQEIIEKTLSMARILSSTDLGEEKLDEAEFMKNREQMRMSLQGNLLTPDQSLKNWIRKVLALRIRDANSVINLSGGGLSFSN